jgi:hypothetical protein
VTPTIPRKKRSHPNPAMVNPIPAENWGINGYNIRFPISKIKRARNTIPIIWTLIPKNRSALLLNETGFTIWVKIFS